MLQVGKPLKNYEQERCSQIYTIEWSIFLYCREKICKTDRKRDHLEECCINSGNSRWSLGLGSWQKSCWEMQSLRATQEAKSIEHQASLVWGMRDRRVSWKILRFPTCTFGGMLLSFIQIGDIGGKHCKFTIEHGHIQTGSYSDMRG